jgi:hypothetical protein
MDLKWNYKNWTPDEKMCDLRNVNLSLRIEVDVSLPLK